MLHTRIIFKHQGVSKNSQQNLSSQHVFVYFLRSFQILHQVGVMHQINKVFPSFVIGLTWLIFNHGQTSSGQSISRRLCFTQTDPATFLPLVPKRLTPSGWRGVSDAFQCARHSLMAFPVSKGFMYNSVSGLCSPLLSLEGPSTSGAQSAQPDEGDLYLSCGFGVCGDQFDIIEVGTTGELVCLKYFNTTKVTQSVAASHCAALGAYLVPVKSPAKLQLIMDIATNDIWVGFQYLRHTGIRYWYKDGDILTTQQYLDLFSPGEPDDFGGNEDCGNFRFVPLGLNDIACGNQYHYICEKDVPGLF